MLAVGAAPAVAAPPEAPEVTVESPVPATTATLHGILNPKAAGEGGTYEFLYKASATECEGGSHAPESPGFSVGLEHEEVTEGLTGLTPNTQYTVCLRAEGELAKEAAVGPPVTFTTALPPEAPKTEPATAVSTSTAVLHGVLDPKNPGNPGTYEFVYRESSSECQGTGDKLAGAGAMTGVEGQSVEAEVSGLLPNATYSFCLLARNQAGETAVGPAVTFTTPPVKPTIVPESEAATSITATSASLTARINPNGAATTYVMEYGTTTAYGSSTPAAGIGSGRSAVPVSQPVSVLTENATYHWRLLATNAAGTTPGPDNTFIYSTAPPTGGCPDEQARQERRSTSLPDCRAYEMVTPPHKNEALIGEAFLRATPPQIAGSGQRLIALSVQCFAGPETCVAARTSEGEPYEFARTPGGWVTHPLAPPARFETNSWWSVNADAGTTLFDIPSAPESQVDDFYARDEHGTFTNIGPIGEDANVSQLRTGALIATADLSHVVYETSLPVWSFDQTAGQPALYEYTGAGKATPLMVGVRGGPESHELISICSTSLGGSTSNQALDGSLSKDGSTVYFAAEGRAGNEGCEHNSTPATAPPVRELYARIDGGLSDARSVLISGPTPTACSSEECHKNTTENANARDANFVAASADGSRAFFTDTQQLTNAASEDPNAESTAARGCDEIVEPGGCNLYESVCPAPCGTPGEEPNASNREVIDVSEGPGGAPVPGGPRVQGLLASSADGSHVYFVARGVLSGNEENHNHEHAEDEKSNLYLYERDEAHPEGHLTFIATLAHSDESQWRTGKLEANATPNGRFLVFTSHRALTPDDTREEGPAQVFEYDAQTKTLTRVSVGEGGYNDNGNHGVLGGPLVVGSAGDAVLARAQNTMIGSVPVRSDPTMSHDGAFVFFESPVALTPGALNDVSVGEQFAQNVYEYHEGHVSLISDGRDTTGESRIEVSPVELLGSDASGANVFLATFDPLVPEDTDNQRDYYDAHICSTGEPCAPPVPAPPVPCEGEACHSAAPGAPGGQMPGSESFTGPGNLAPAPPTPPKGKSAAQRRAEKLAGALKICRKKHAKKRAACERRARKAYGAKKASKSSRARRAGNTRRARP